MASMQEQVFQLRERIALLEGQRAMAETGLRMLKEIACPNCNGAGYFQREENGTVYQDDCKVCQRSGKAAGKVPGF